MGTGPTAGPVVAWGQDLSGGEYGPGGLTSPLKAALGHDVMGMLKSAGMSPWAPCPDDALGLWGERTTCRGGGGGQETWGTGLLCPPAPSLGDPSHSPTFNPCQRAPRLWGAPRQPQFHLPLSHPDQPHISSAGPKFHAHLPLEALAGDEGSARFLPRTRACWWRSLSRGLIPPLQGLGLREGVPRSVASRSWVG